MQALGLTGQDEDMHIYVMYACMHVSTYGIYDMHVFTCVALSLCYVWMDGRMYVHVSCMHG